MLNTVILGTSVDRPPLLIAHGLFGSARNWGVIARRLSDDRQVVAVDMRNHGASFHDDAHGYEDMAGDLSVVLDGFSGPVDVVGHSMGGKAAMMLALRHPDQVRRLVVADIAPVTYDHTQMHLIDAMRALPVKDLGRRSEADVALAAAIPAPGVRAFLLQSLDLDAHRWRLNLDVLARRMDDIIGWPVGIEATFVRPTLFLSGGASDYVLPVHRPAIRTLFSKARFAKLAGAGHWLHAEKPREFEASVRAFLAD